MHQGGFYLLPFSVGAGTGGRGSASSGWARCSRRSCSSPPRGIVFAGLRARVARTPPPPTAGDPDRAARARRASARWSSSGSPTTRGVGMREDRGRRGCGTARQLRRRRGDRRGRARRRWWKSGARPPSSCTDAVGVGCHRGNQKENPPHGRSHRHRSGPSCSPIVLARGGRSASSPQARAGGGRAAWAATSPHAGAGPHDRSRPFIDRVQARSWIWREQVVKLRPPVGESPKTTWVVGIETGALLHDHRPRARRTYEIANPLAGDRGS